MSDTSFDERDRSLGYGRRTYHAACAPGVDVTEAQLYAMRRLAVVLGLTPNGGKRARPEKLCALLAQHYASAPGAQLAELPRDLRSLVVAMLDDRSARRLALTSVSSALDASASAESRRERVHALVTPLVFWLVATGVLEADVKSDHLDYSFDALATRSVRRGALARIQKIRDTRGNEGVAYGEYRDTDGKDDVTYAEWRRHLDALGDGSSADLTRSVRALQWNLESYCLHVNVLVGAKLAHPLLMVAVLHALLKAGELINIDARLQAAATLTHASEQVAVLFKQSMLTTAHRDRLLVMGNLARLLDAGEATVRDVKEVANSMQGWRIAPSTAATLPQAAAQLILTADVWEKVVHGVLSGPAAGILTGLAQQLNTA